jgi:hypothetical protein
MKSAVKWATLQPGKSLGEQYSMFKLKNVKAPGGNGVSANAFKCLTIENGTFYLST